MTKKNKTKPWKLVLRLLLAAVFLLAAFRLIDYFRENAESSRAQEELIDQAVRPVPSTQPEIVTTEPTVTQETEPLQETTEPPQETIPAISYEIPIEVDFEVLKAECPDIVGWIYSKGTPINYPVVQSDDNEYYLHRLPDGSYNSSGSLFMDFRCLSDVTDTNTIIYGHNMGNGSMFASLLGYEEQSYYEEHPVIWYLTPERAYKLELVAGFVTPSDSSTYDIYNSEQELMDHLQYAVEESTFRSGVDLQEVRRVMTLSTCTYDYAIARYVIIASVLPAEYLPKG